MEHVIRIPQKLSQNFRKFVTLLSSKVPSGCFNESFRPILNLVLFILFLFECILSGCWHVEPEEAAAGEREDHGGGVGLVAPGHELDAVIFLGQKKIIIIHAGAANHSLFLGNFLHYIGNVSVNENACFKKRFKKMVGKHPDETNPLSRRYMSDTFQG